MDPTLQLVIDIVAMLVRFLGMLAFGFAAGWFTLEAFRKGGWQVQAAAILGLLGAAVGLAHYTSAGALGAFGLAAGGAILLFGMPRKKSEEGESGRK
jgi:hypothetical protein